MTSAATGQPTTISKAAAIMAAPIPRLAFLWASCFSWMNGVTMALATISTLATIYVAWHLFKDNTGIPTVLPSTRFGRWVNFLVKNI